MAHQEYMKQILADNCGVNATIENAATTSFYYNLTCVDIFIEFALASGRKVDPTLNRTFDVLYALLCFVAFFGNGLVIYAVLRNAQMRTNRNVLITNLAFSNLVLSLLIIPLLWWPSTYNDYPINSPTLCKLQNSLSASSIYSSTLTVSAMAIDRYYTVKSMSMGDSTRIQRIIFATAIGIWIGSFLLSLPLFMLYDLERRVIVQNITGGPNAVARDFYGFLHCNFGSHFSADVQATLTLSIGGVQICFLYVVPLIILSWFNYKLSSFLRANARKINQRRNKIENKSLLTPPARPVLHVDEYGQDDSPVGARQNGQSLNRQAPAKTTGSASEHRRSRTTALLVTMAGSFGLLWLPFTLLTLLLDLSQLEVIHLNVSMDALDKLMFVAKYVSLLSICVNPFLYGFLNTNFKREFADIFKSAKRCWPKSNAGLANSPPSRQRRRHRQQMMDATSILNHVDEGDPSSSQHQNQALVTSPSANLLAVPTKTTHVTEI